MIPLAVLPAEVVTAWEAYNEAFARGQPPTPTNLCECLTIAKNMYKRCSDLIVRCLLDLVPPVTGRYVACLVVCGVMLGATGVPIYLCVPICGAIEAAPYMAHYTYCDRMVFTPCMNQARTYELWCWQVFGNNHAGEGGETHVLKVMGHNADGP